MNSVTVLIKKTLAVLTICSTVVYPFTAALAREGGTSGGGQYKYYYTTYKHLRGIKSFLSGSILDENPVILQNLATKHGAQVDWKEFAAILRKKIAVTQGKIESINDDDSQDEKLMTYDTETRSLVMSPEVLELYHKESLSREETVKLMKDLIHETSHLFKIGTAGETSDPNGDYKSKLFTDDLSDILAKYYYRCANDTNLPLGTPFQLIQSCEKYKPKVFFQATPFQNMLRFEISSPRNGSKSDMVCDSAIKVWSLKGDLTSSTVVENKGQRLLSESEGIREINVDLTSIQPGNVILTVLSCSTNFVESLQIKLSGDNQKIEKIDSYATTNIIAAKVYEFTMTDKGLLLHNHR